MGTPLGDFVRARREATRPETSASPLASRRRAPGLRRSELAALAGISVEYLARIEQGRDRHPSPPSSTASPMRSASTWPNAIHLHLAKISGGACVGSAAGAARVDVRPAVREIVGS